MAERRVQVLGLLGLVSLVGVGSFPGARPALPHEGEVRVEGEALRLGAGARLTVGTGQTLSARGEGDAWELGLGEEGAARIQAGKIQLVDTNGQATTSVAGKSLPGGQDPWLRCLGRLEAGAGEHGLEHGPNRKPCKPTTAWIEALAPLRLETVYLDGQVVELRAPPRPDIYRTGIGLGAGLALAIVLGLARLWPLLLSPLAFLLPIPVPATLAALGGACGVVRGGGRGYGIAVVSLMLAAGLVLVQPTTPPTDSLTSAALAPMVGPAVLQYKVDEMRQATAPALAQASRPLIVALGGSSSGGGTRGRFWPQVLQERLQGRASVVSLAWGGATTWHLLRLMEEAQVQADICILYIGHNDLSAALPGRSIRQLLADQPATQQGLVAPVPLADARENVLAMRAHCGQILAMQERVAGRETVMAEYGAMLSTLPGVRWVDGTTIVRPEHLMDDVHLHPPGHEVLAAEVHARMEDWLEVL